MFKTAQEKTEIDALISELLGESSPVSVPADESETETFEQFTQDQYYQLPVKHTQGGALIDDNNKPWIVGHFLPGQYINETHKGGHNGVDLKAPRGTPVYPIGPGVVINTSPNAKGGNVVRISHEDGKVKSYYAHLDSVDVSGGEEVSLSTVIGRMGDSGNAKGRGAHLHYEVFVDGTNVDPKSVTGKRVGSISKKAQFIKKFIDGLKKQSKLSKKERYKVLRKIAVEINESFTLNETEKKIFALLKQVVADKAHGTTLRVAGGWVRDKLLGKESHDIDIAVDNMSGLAFARLTREWMQENGMKVPKDVAVVEANPDAKKSLETAILNVMGIPIDFVQLRADVYGSDTRRPDTVAGVPPEEDAKRRDLSINSIFYNVNNGEIEDFVGGVEDLKNGIARTPLDPFNTFMEDPLRILRAVRFAAKYNLEIAPELIEAAKRPEVQNAFKQKISKERVWAELVGQPEGEGWKRGLMVGPNFDRAAELLGDMGLREMLLVPNKEQLQRAFEKSKEKHSPKWEQGFGNWEMDQNNPYHNLDVWKHTLKALNYLHKVHEANVSSDVERNVEDQVVRNIAMLMHDMGKCDACSQQTHPEKGHSTYHEHELSSAVIADEILRDLKAPTEIRERIVNLIKNHMRLHTLPSGSKGSGLRRVLRDVGSDNWPLLVEMSQSDSMGKKETELDPKYEAFAQKITEFLDQTQGQSEAPVPLNGHEIMQILGLERGGPAVGQAVKALKEQMLENPELTKQEAEAFLRSQ